MLLYDVKTPNAGMLLIDGTFVVDAAGVVGTTTGSGYSVDNDGGAGEWTITVTDPFTRVLSAHVGGQLAAAADIGWCFGAISVANRTFKVYQYIGGALADTAGTIHFQLALSNSISA